jgi:hypothetical protein
MATRSFGNIRWAVIQDMSASLVKRKAEMLPLSVDIPDAPKSLHNGQLGVVKQDAWLSTHGGDIRCISQRGEFAERPFAMAAAPATEAFLHLSLIRV